MLSPIVYFRKCFKKACYEISYFLDMRCVEGEVKPKRPQLDFALFYLVQDEPVINVAEARQLSNVQIVSGKRKCILIRILPFSQLFQDEPVVHAK